MSEDVLVFRDLTDDEISNLTTREIDEARFIYQFEGVPYRATVKSLLEDYGIKYDDLSDFILNFEVGYCNYANRTDDSILISRKGNFLRDNIVINLNDDYDVPDLVLQVQVMDNFVHEEAYNEDGLLLYRA